VVGGCATRGINKYAGTQKTVRVEYVLEAHSVSFNLRTVNDPIAAERYPIFGGSIPICKTKRMSYTIVRRTQTPDIKM
jgi:hypothetical protein